MICRSSQFWLLPALIVLAGCGGSPPIHYYTLSAEAAPDAGLAGKNEQHITVGPVTLPDVIERPQLVLRATPNRVTLVEEHQWAEPLQSEIPRVIAENLTRLLGTKQVSVYPQSAGDQAQYRILVDVQQFESALGGRASIDAFWTIRKNSQGDPSVRSGRSSAEEPVGGSSYEALAAAHSRGLVRVSRDIAEALRSMEKAVP
ncbi:MAG TPA: PqiC family protein [Nitrospiraceae bacterium]|nr:PqiC family protein [Nitrospiraceae bacterium]